MPQQVLVAFFTATISMTTVDAVVAVRASFPNYQPSRVIQVGSKSGWMMVPHQHFVCCLKQKQICLNICLVAWLDLAKSFFGGLHWASLSSVHETWKQIMLVLDFYAQHYIKERAVAWRAQPIDRAPELNLSCFYQSYEFETYWWSCSS